MMQDILPSLTYSNSFKCSYKTINTELDEAENRLMYSDYYIKGFIGEIKVSVTIAKKIHDQFGIITGYDIVKKNLDNLLHNLDGHKLNKLEEFQNKLITLELLAAYIWQKLSEEIYKIHDLVKLELANSDNFKIELSNNQLEFDDVAGFMV